MSSNKHTKSVLIVGAGIAGIQSALDLAELGADVYLVEETPSIGGRMPQLDKTFPTNDCSICILAPKMVEAGRHPNIKLLTNSEVEEVLGEAGNFKVKIKKKPRYIEFDKCTGCGVCMTACPVRNEPQIQPTQVYSKEIELEKIAELDEIMMKYASVNPGYLGKEMLIQILQDINLKYNYLPAYTLKYVSEKLKLSLSEVYHVATFYTAFSLKPRGKHLVKVCMGTACHTRGSPKILDEVERQLQIKRGETTPDLQFTLETVNCLGCCALAPVVTVDENYYSISVGKVKSLLKKYKGDE